MSNPLHYARPTPPPSPTGLKPPRRLTQNTVVSAHLLLVAAGSLLLLTTLSHLRLFYSSILPILILLPTFLGYLCLFATAIYYGGTLRDFPEDAPRHRAVRRSLFLALVAGFLVIGMGFHPNCTFVITNRSAIPITISLAINTHHYPPLTIAPNATGSIPATAAGGPLTITLHAPNPLLNSTELLDGNFDEDELPEFAVPRVPIFFDGKKFSLP